MILQILAISTAKQDESTKLVYALALSIIVHVLLMASLNLSNSQLERIPQPIVIDLIREITPNLIAPPSKSDGKPLKNVKTFLSEKDSASRIQQIKRGMPDAAPVAATQKPSSPQPKTQKPKTQTKLKLDAQDLFALNKSLEDRKIEKTKAQQQDAKPNTKDYQPFRRNLSFGRIGSPDLLPDVRDGEITLLNAKADRFAVFIRRVAIQVFSKLRQSSWQKLSFAKAQSSAKFSIVRISLNRQGKIIAAKLVESSGNSAFDKILLESARASSWDHNPPEGAFSSDGNIHIIYQSKTWAQMVGDARNERRWILLGTGLE